MNIRRGVNRLFIVAWCAYGLYVAWYAYNKEVDDDLKFAGLGWDLCVQENHGSAYETGKYCKAEEDKAFTEAFQRRDARLRDPSWIGLVLLFMVAPPLLFYGVGLLVVKIVMWVVAGFRQPRSDIPTEARNARDRPD